MQDYNAAMRLYAKIQYKSPNEATLFLSDTLISAPNQQAVFLLQILEEQGWEYEAVRGHSRRGTEYSLIK